MELEVAQRQRRPARDKLPLARRISLQRRLPRHMQEAWTTTATIGVLLPCPKSKDVTSVGEGNQGASFDCSRIRPEIERDMIWSKGTDKTT
jgi:hypothetical protein